MKQNATVADQLIRIIWSVLYTITLVRLYAYTYAYYACSMYVRAGQSAGLCMSFLVDAWNTFKTGKISPVFSLLENLSLAILFHASPNYYPRTKDKCVF